MFGYHVLNSPGSLRDYNCWKTNTKILHSHDRRLKNDESSPMTLWLTEAFKGKVAKISVPVYVLRSSSRKTSEQARGLAELSRKS